MKATPTAVLPTFATACTMPEHPATLLPLPGRARRREGRRASRSGKP